MRQQIYPTIGLKTIAFSLLMAGMFAMAPVCLASDALDTAIASYRGQNYKQALHILTSVHAHAPDNTKATYYLAITQAQLGNYSESRRLYNEILVLDPYSKEARLAEEGLTYLPVENKTASKKNTQLDQPPQFQQDFENANPFASKQQQATQQQTGMNPQDMMAMQMMMGQNNLMSPMAGMNMNNNNNSGMFNPMMNPMLMQKMMSGGQVGPDGKPQQMDPQVMSTWIMNQMMQNMNFDTNNNDNR